MKTTRYFGIFIAALFGGFVSLFVYTKYVNPQKVTISAEQPSRYQLTGYADNSNGGAIDFTGAAERTVHSVVHIVTTQNQQYYSSIMDLFFGRPPVQAEPRESGAGSGVIITADGYIVTNNHVVQDADGITVNLNDKRSYKAKLIGRDPRTDLAVIKIDEKELPFITYGNSDELKIGEWVLAVGNPFNLTSTVTSGIISAKSRNLGLMSGIYENGQRQSGIESFIQTDAAVNPGSSGGALVNTKGELIGINTLIYSTTGNYSGSSFAIPVTIVRKVVADIIEFGKVQRALLGISMQDVTSDIAKEKKLDKIEGVYVNEVFENGAAKSAGIEKGDIILSINNLKTNNSAEIQEVISRYRPNDKVEIQIKRENKEKQIVATLRNSNGTTKIISQSDILSTFGATFIDISNNERKSLGLKGGIKISELTDGKLKTEGVTKGFIVVRVNNQFVASVDDLKRIVTNAKGMINIEGIYLNGVIAYYTLSLD